MVPFSPPRYNPAPMLRFIASRLLQFPLILAVICLLTFLLAWAAPGSPFENPERKLDPIAQHQLEKQFHAEHWSTFPAIYPVKL